jgi:serine O-acetyltransferase
MTTWDTIIADLAFTGDCEPPASRLAQVKLVSKYAVTVRGFAMIGHRLAHRIGQHSTLVGGFIKQITHAVTGAEISYRAEIGPGLRILHPVGIVIASEVVIGDHVTIHQGVTLGLAAGGPKGGAPIIGNNVAIGSGAVITGPVKVADGCLVGANSVMLKTLGGPNSVFAGVPARFIREV